MERKWLTLDQIKAEYTSNDYNPELLLQHLLHHVDTGPASAPEVPEDVIDAVTIALRKAFQLGQTYWQQADSDYISQNKKSDETYSKFLKLGEEISAMLAAAPTQPVSEERKDAEIERLFKDRGIEHDLANRFGFENNDLRSKVAKQAAALKLAREATELEHDFGCCALYVERWDEALAAINALKGEVE